MTVRDGTTLVVTAPANAEVVVQREDARPVASCPGHPACRQDGGRTVLELTIVTPGRYQAALVRRGQVVEASQPIWISAETP